MNRRTVLRSALSVGAAALAGCAGADGAGDGTDDGPSTPAEDGASGDASADGAAESDATDADAAGARGGSETSDAPAEPVVVEYGTTVKDHDEVPEAVPEGFYPHRFQWVVVGFELVAGAIDAGELMGLTRLRLNGSTLVARALIVTAPEEVLLQSPDDSYPMAAGDAGDIYYRIDQEPTDVEWSAEPLARERDVTVRER